MKSLAPGWSPTFQGVLLRPPLRAVRGTKVDSSLKLVKKFLGVISIKGEDLLLQASTDVHVRFHRLQASIPSRLWRWRTVAGWTWKSHTDHINVLELRAILSTVKWRLEQRGQMHKRWIHLTDSLACLHSLCRGRTSSRKLRRTLTRINCLLLATRSQPLWGYVHTHQNPADRPSRRGVRRKWLKQ